MTQSAHSSNNKTRLTAQRGRALLFSALTLLALPALTACGIGTPGTPTPAARPADLSVTYEYRAGSMPPPFHNEYTVVVGPGTQGKVDYRPDYPGDKTPTWTEVLTPTTAQMDALFALVRSENLMRENWRGDNNPPVGGGVEWATITANGRTIEIPHALVAGDSSSARALYDFMQNEMVPKEVWDRLEAKRTEYQNSFGTPTP